VVKGGGFPGTGGMAGIALGAICASMMIIGCMAGVTSLRRTLEYTVGVAFGASYTDVSAGQFEGGQVVIKCGGFPGGSGVARTAIEPKCATVGILALMAGDTVG